MMEAVALEKGDWLGAAEQRYATLLKKYPNDNMLRIMYAAFWMRYGLEPKAKAVLISK
jgi:TolA-binding protein